MNSTLLIIPAYNEAENIERVVDNLIENYPQFDYVVINDGSRDDTLSILYNRGYNYLGSSGQYRTRRSLSVWCPLCECERIRLCRAV